MDDKQELLALLTPKAVLRAMTPQADRAVPDGMIESGLVCIRRFPYRVGRESRGTIVDGQFRRIERPRLGNQKPNNDLYLIDAGELLNVSREHFQIEKAEAGYLVFDRGSACGTVVGGLRIGAGSGRTSAPLHDGDTIAIGTDSSPYLFTFIVCAAADNR